MKGLVAALAAAAVTALGFGITHVAAESFSVYSGTSVDGNRISDSSSAAISVRAKSEVHERARGTELWLILLS